jgi:HEAT repeat protein
MGKVILGFLFGLLTGVLLGAWGIWPDHLAEMGSRDGRTKEATYEGKPASFWIHQLKDRASAYRLNAIQALEHLAPAAEDVVPALAELLKDDSARVRMCGALALGRLGGQARSATPALLVLLKDADGFVRFQAVRALGRIGPAEEPLVTALMSALQDERAAVRRATLEALGTMYPAAKKALTEIRGALQDPDPGVRREAESTLKRFEDQERKEAAGACLPPSSARPRKEDAQFGVLRALRSSRLGEKENGRRG